MTPMPMLHRLLPVLALLAAPAWTAAAWAADPYLTTGQLEMPWACRDALRRSAADGTWRLKEIPCPTSP